MPFLAAVVAAFVPAFAMACLIYWLDRYEKEPLILLGASFFWGAVVAAGGSYLLNTVFGLSIYAFTGSGDVADQATSSLVAPVVEEALKGAALLGIFLAFRREFDSILDGIIYAGITALGFAATENVMYIYEYGYVEGGWEGFWRLVLIRDLVVAWQHPFYTAFTGIGLAFARLHKGVLVKLAATAIGFSFAVFTHGFHNSFLGVIGGLAGSVIESLIDWTGWLLMAVFILFMITRERGLMERHLKDEVAGGVLSTQQYARALSPWTMSFAWVTGGATAARFFRLCGELAHKKEQLSRLGDEHGNATLIRGLRDELAGLSQRMTHSDRARQKSLV